MKYYYARISTKKQSLERQIESWRKNYPDAVLIKEVFTGTTDQRPQWQKLYSKLKSGDVVIFDSVSRMSRNSNEGWETYKALYDKGIELIFENEPHVNTMVYRNALSSAIPMTNSNVDFILEGINKFLNSLAEKQIKLAFDQAEKEVNDLKIRTSQALQVIKLNGKTLGHEKGIPIIQKNSIEDKQTIIKYHKDFNGTLNSGDVLKLCHCCKKTFYQYLKELKGEHNYG